MEETDRYGCHLLQMLQAMVWHSARRCTGPVSGARILSPASLSLDSCSGCPRACRTWHNVKCESLNLPSIIISFFVFTIGYLYAFGNALSTLDVAAYSFFLLSLLVS
jgi:hypothetical protein